MVVLKKKKVFLSGIKKYSTIGTKSHYEDVFEDLVVYKIIQPKEFQTKLEFEQQIKNNDKRRTISNTLIQELTNTNNFKEVIRTKEFPELERVRALIQSKTTAEEKTRYQFKNKKIGFQALINNKIVFFSTDGRARNRKGRFTKI